MSPVAATMAVAVSGSNVYAGGWFINAGGKPSYRFARWGAEPAAPFDLRITDIRWSDINCVISFTTQTGQSYFVQYKDNLTDVSWSPLATNLVGTGGVMAVTNLGIASLTKRFYRAGQQQ